MVSVSFSGKSNHDQMFTVYCLLNYGLWTSYVFIVTISVMSMSFAVLMAHDNDMMI